MAISQVVSKFINNEFFKKTIISTVMYDQIGYKNEDFVMNNLLNGFDLSEEERKRLFSDELYGLGMKHGVFSWIEHFDLNTSDNKNKDNL